jgi:hypothetical protein
MPQREEAIPAGRLHRYGHKAILLCHYELAAEHLKETRLEEVRLNYFDVDRCGYHRHGNDTPEFGGLSDTLAEISTWARGKTLRQTKTFDPGDNDSVFPVYLSDMATNPVTGDSVFVTWNETPTFEGRVTAAGGDDLVGAVDVELVDVPDGKIPGFPCYFLFIPEHSTLVCVRFNGQMHTGQPGFARYIQEFLSRYSSHVVLVGREDGVEVTAYTAGPTEAPNGALPYYRTRVTKVPGKIEWLRGEIANIRKLVRKDVLTSGLAPNRTRFNDIWSWFGVINPMPAAAATKFDFEIDCALTEQEFTSLVQFEQRDDDPRRDMGFKLRGSNETHWLSHALVKQEFNLNVERNEAGLVTAESLLAALSGSRRHILSIVP